VKRTRHWWSGLTEQERAELVHLERAANRGGRSAYYPDDCSGCGSCGTPHLGWGLCPLCSNRLAEIISKADSVTTAGLNQSKENEI